MPPVGVFHGTLEALVTILIPGTKIKCQDWNVHIDESKERGISVVVLLSFENVRNTCQDCKVL